MSLVLLMLAGVESASAWIMAPRHGVHEESLCVTFTFVSHVQCPSLYLADASFNSAWDPCFNFVVDSLREFRNRVTQRLRWSDCPCDLQGCQVQTPDCAQSNKDADKKPCSGAAIPETQSQSALSVPSSIELSADQGAAFHLVGRPQQSAKRNIAQDYEKFALPLPVAPELVRHVMKKTRLTILSSPLVTIRPLQKVQSCKVAPCSYKTHYSQPTASLRSAMLAALMLTRVHQIDII